MGGGGRATADAVTRLDLIKIVYDSVVVPWCSVADDTPPSPSILPTARRRSGKKVGELWVGLDTDLLEFGSQR